MCRKNTNLLKRYYEHRGVAVKGNICRETHHHASNKNDNICYM